MGLRLTISGYKLGVITISSEVNHLPYIDYIDAIASVETQHEGCFWWETVFLHVCEHIHYS